MMTTADIALITDSNYKRISQDFHKNPEKFAILSLELGLSYYIEIWALR